jgi:hypothetical protein
MKTKHAIRPQAGKSLRKETVNNAASGKKQRPYCADDGPKCLVNNYSAVTSIDADVEETVSRGCATQECANPVGAGNVYCADCRQALIQSWYRATASGPTTNFCVVRGCGRPSTFYLCDKHAVPGWAHYLSILTAVESFWLVERQGERSLIAIIDYALGHQFGSQMAFEQWLRAGGYKIHKLISEPEELESIQRQNPGIPFRFVVYLRLRTIKEEGNRDAATCGRNSNLCWITHRAWLRQSCRGSSANWKKSARSRSRD